jgi:hypothetical protein
MKPVVALILTLAAGSFAFADSGQIISFRMKASEQTCTRKTPNHPFQCITSEPIENRTMLGLIETAPELIEDQAFLGTSAGQILVLPKAGFYVGAAEVRKSVAVGSYEVSYLITLRVHRPGEDNRVVYEARTKVLYEPDLLKPLQLVMEPVKTGENSTAQALISLEKF